MSSIRSAGVRRAGAPRATPRRRRRRCRGAAGPTVSARAVRRSSGSAPEFAVVSSPYERNMSQSCQPPWIRRLRPGPGSRCRRASRRQALVCAAASSTAPPTSTACASPTSRWPTVHEVLTTPDRFVWIGMYEPNEELLREVQREFDLHDLAVEDAHNAHQRPKFEVYDDSLFVVLRTAQMSGAPPHIAVRRDPRLRRQELRRVGAARLAAVARRPADALRSDAAAAAQGPGLRPLRADGLHRRSVLPDRRSARGRARRRSRTRSSATTSAATTTTRIYQLKRELLAVKRAVSPLVEVCNRLTRFDVDLIPEDTRPYFRDVYDHVIRINDMIDNTRELLTTALEANLSLITDLAERGHQAPRRLGRDHHHADPDRQHLRHELRAHARAGLALGLPGRSPADGDRFHGPLHRLQAFRVVLTSLRPCGAYH